MSNKLPVETILVGVEAARKRMVAATAEYEKAVKDVKAYQDACPHPLNCVTRLYRVDGDGTRTLVMERCGLCDWGYTVGNSDRLW